MTYRVSHMREIIPRRVDVYNIYIYIFVIVVIIIITLKMKLKIEKKKRNLKRFPSSTSESHNLAIPKQYIFEKPSVVPYPSMIDWLLTTPPDPSPASFGYGKRKIVLEGHIERRTELHGKRCIHNIIEYWYCFYITHCGPDFRVRHFTG